MTGGFQREPFTIPYKTWIDNASGRRKWYLGTRMGILPEEPESAYLGSKISRLARIRLVEVMKLFS